MAPRLSFTEKYREGLLKAEAMEAALPQPQSQHSRPVRVDHPPTSGLGLLLGEQAKEASWGGVGEGCGDHMSR